MFSKVDAIKEKILKDINSGRLKPGSLIPSRHQFMRRFDCARGSIDSAVSDLVKSGFLYSRQGSGTFVSEKMPSSEVQEVIIMDTFNSAFRLTPGIETGRLASEIQRSMPCSIYSVNDLNMYITRIARPGNAIIWVRPTYAQLLYMNYIADMGIPQLLIGRTYGDFDYVTTEAGDSIHEGLKWLISKAGRNIAFVSESLDSDYPYIAERKIAFYEAAASERVALNPDWIMVKNFINFEKDMKDIALTLFKAGETKPAGIFLSYASAGLSLIDIAEANVLKLGKDLHVLLFDEDSRLMREGVAMLRQRWEDMFDAAHNWAVNYNKAKKSGLRIKIKTELIKG